MVAMMLREKGVPVVCCCETYKFSERIMLDSIVGNERGESLRQFAPLHPADTEHRACSHADTTAPGPLSVRLDCTGSSRCWLEREQIGPDDNCVDSDPDETPGVPLPAESPLRRVATRGCHRRDHGSRIDPGTERARPAEGLQTCSRQKHLETSRRDEC